MGRIVMIILIYIAITTIALIPWWRIFKKAGYAGFWSFMILVPLVNLVVLYWFAFSEWPLEKRAVKVEVEEAVS